MKSFIKKYYPVAVFVIVFAALVFIVLRSGKEEKAVAYPIVNNSNYYVWIEETETLNRVDEKYLLAREITIQMYLSSYSK